MRSETLQRTPLFEEHLRLKARMVPFGGWEMPVQYETGILAEYERTRKKAAIFDICHMGEFIIEGAYDKSGLDRIVTQSLKDLPVGQSRYGCMLNDQGGVIDDLIIFRLAQDKWYVVVNASTRLNDRKHFEDHLTSDAKFTDVSDETGKIDLQGPLARDVLKQLVHDIGKLNYFHFDFFDLLGQNVLISRTGYTGELGYEIFFPSNKTADLWRELLKYEYVKPAGLGARDMLRLEVGYSLYGHELDQNTSVLESGLKRFIDLNKEFIGKDALQQQIKEGTKRKLAGFISSSRRSPRAEQNIYSAQGAVIGRVTSGSFSPAVNAGIGLGFIETSHAVKGETVFFGDEKNRAEAKISDKIFYNEGSIRN